MAGMTEWKSLWIGGALALAAVAAGAAPAAMTKQAYKQAYKQAGDRIATQYKAEQAACNRVRGNSRDLCMLQAKAHRQVAQAQLEAQYKPSPEADRKAMDAKAAADYALAKARCDGLKGNAKDSCELQAKVQRDAARRLAVVEKVEKINALKDKQAKAPRVETPAQHFAAQKAWCQIQGAQRDQCMDELKRRYGKA
jgi:hypothetical protein